MGMIGAAFGVGFVVGPALGGLLATRGASLPMFVAGGLALTNALLALRFLPESLPVQRRTGSARPLLGPARLRSLLALPGPLRALFAASFLTTLAFAGTEATLALWANRQMGFGPRGVALMFAYIGIIAAVSQGGLAGWASGRWGERRVAVAGTALLATGFAALPSSETSLMLGVALALIAAGYGTAGPTLTAMVSRAAGDDRQGGLLGISQSLGALARVAGPLAAGAAFAYWTVAAPYLGGALLASLALAVLALGRR
jgi:MFS transporter, DHA1 family, tetracycline resistance protein